ncbi:putative transcriptional regulator YdeE [Breznakia sp. PF5-3]|uniref:GyrI-like domain-containing protein n=1 Tax=unclassified Breznakia TaxID=2623764 RepID=UPI002405376C|nr:MULTISPECIES: GyrI-like domain-containing protein [unclassified Breznakia]MDF9824302.1 putative transcriptional regulator YdeE [Breznakia sp. PM6-1]MDF9835526.1 putative transcriptional regulator YdeE [Breznakia sp. PF5-3]MDF9838793.1 putative transcriptional regulator YdeE [Breznakia sp. PFB2-8]MDF9860819.1 putative transcriptional regulator YdeE [Breznakia sp. PH5-24]
MKYTIEDWPAFEVSGFKESIVVEESFQKIPVLWDEALKSNRFKELIDLWKRADMRPVGVLGVAYGVEGSATSMMDYILGVTTYVDVVECSRMEIPKMMQTIKIPKAKWIVIQADGDAAEAVQEVYKTFYSQWLPNSGYQLADLPVVECYKQNGHQEVWIAIQK